MLNLEVIIYLIMYLFFKQVHVLIMYQDQNDMILQQTFLLLIKILLSFNLNMINIHRELIL